MIHLFDSFSRKISTAYVVLVFVLGGVMTMIYIMSTTHSTNGTSLQLDSKILLGFGLAIFVIAIVGTYLLSAITKPLIRLQISVSAFAKGQLDQRIVASTIDDLGRLANSFNAMADTIVENMEEFERTDLLRKELIANISHDLRSPLSSIQGYLETILMKDDALSSIARRKYIGIALKNTKTLNKLVGELFDLSKMDAQQVKPKCEAFSIAELVQDMAIHFRPNAEKKRIRLQVNLPEYLSLVYADIGLVERAVTNLIDNAIRYTPIGGDVFIKTSDTGDAVNISVSDNGIGIPTKDLPHIFDRFYRVEKSRDRGRGGAGLGLAITKKILELHGTTIHVQSKLNKGTTFSFKLPAWNTVFFDEHSMPKS